MDPGEKKDSGKKTIPEALQGEVYRLWSEESWSYQRLADWLRDKHNETVSREWVRRYLEREREARVLGMAPVATVPEELDDDQQGQRMQHEIYRAFNAAKRIGDVPGALNAARTWTQVVLTRKKLRDPAPGGADVQEPVIDVGLRVPMFGVTNGRS